jgi:hypothetical protein
MLVKVQAENRVDLRRYARRRAVRLALGPALGAGPGQGSRPRGAGNRRLVEAGGQHIRGFRRGLDYAFVRAPLRPCVDAERVIQPPWPAGS